jgi:hypothetical protein
LTGFEAQVGRKFLAGVRLFLKLARIGREFHMKQGMHNLQKREKVAEEQLLLCRHVLDSKPP